MKQIRVVKTAQTTVSTSGTNLVEVHKVAEQARMNRLQVIEGALTVENQLNGVILHYFFGTSHERRVAFESLVLNSDWCSFAAKRKLITHIINEGNLLEGRDKSDFDKLMRDVMSVRNAFAHGNLSSNEKQAWLSFFEGRPRKEELTDEYLTNIEGMLRVALEDVGTRTKDWSNETRRKHQRSLTAGGASRRFQFKKRCELFVGPDDEPLSVVTMRINNPDRSPVGINR